MNRLKSFLAVTALMLCASHAQAVTECNQTVARVESLNGIITFTNNVGPAASIPATSPGALTALGLALLSLSTPRMLEVNFGTGPMLYPFPRQATFRYTADNVACTTYAVRSDLVGIYFY